MDRTNINFTERVNFTKVTPFPSPFVSIEIPFLSEKRSRKEEGARNYTTQKAEERWLPEVHHSPRCARTHTTSVPVEGKESRVNTRECKDPLRRREAFIREFIIKGLLKIVLQARSPLAIHGKKERKAPLSFDPPSALLFAF